MSFIRKIALLILITQPLAAHSSFADIVGGEDLGDSDPAQQSVVALYKETGRGGMLCTATLIGKKFAVTAAHCVDQGVDHMVAIFGRDIQLDSPGALRVVDAEIAPEWRRRHAADQDLGDIAVIRLEGKLPKDYHPAHLLPKKAKLSKGGKVLLVGYGISNARTHEGAGRLRKTHVRIENPDFGKTEILLDQSQGHGACHGDSGGPAFVEQNGKLYLLGVTNRGYPSDAPDDCRHQVVYTKVSVYKKWISESVKELKAGH